ncbi:MAG TPA: hypothetical protein VIK11_09530, partial [Tepidiformaceae bacterium]
ARAIRRAAAKKPMAILKGGRTEAGTRAANSHTASLAGSLDIFDALCRQAGALRVDSVDDLVDAAVTFRFVKNLRGPNVVVVGGGGGVSVQAADDLDAAGLKVPALLPETQAEIQKVTRDAGTSVRNPIDTVAMWEEQGFEGTLMPCAKAPNCDVILFHTSFGGGGPSSRVTDMRTQMVQQVNGLKRIIEETGTPIVIAIRPPTTTDGFTQSAEFQELCWKAGIATYPSIVRAAKALGGLIRWQELQKA